MDQVILDNAKPLTVATREYYWKPMAALFRALELKVYSDLKINFKHPVLDLGCGDGGVVSMLKELEIMGNPPLCGIDYSSVELRKAVKTNAHLGLLGADANALPFEDECFRSVICNGVLCSIPGGVEGALKEINRVLKCNGILVATVPTDKFIDVLILPKFLSKLSSSLSSMYVKKLNSRLPHYNTYSPQCWREQFENSGLSIIESKTFFSSKAGNIWNLLSLQVFRVFGLLKFIRNQKVTDSIGDLLSSVFENIYSENILSEESSVGYILIIAQKKNS